MQVKVFSANRGIGRPNHVTRLARPVVGDSHDSFVVNPHASKQDVVHNHRLLMERVPLVVVWKLNTHNPRRDNLHNITESAVHKCTRVCLCVCVCVCVCVCLSTKEKNKQKKNSLHAATGCHHRPALAPYLHDAPELDVALILLAQHPPVG